MRTVVVTDPSGVSWRVRVRWTPRHRALWRRFSGWRRDRRPDPGDVFDASDGVGQLAGAGRGLGGRLNLPDFFDDGFGIVLLVAATVAVGALVVALFWWLLIPLVLVLVDILAVAVLLALGVLGRVLLRRPWVVEAASAAASHEVAVVGWRRALRARDGIAEGLRAGGAAAWSSLAAERWD